MNQNVFNTPVHFAAGFTAAGDVGLPEACIRNEHVSNAANIAGNKSVIRTRRQFSVGKIDTTVVAGTYRVFSALNAASLVRFRAGLAAACTGDAEITVSLELDGEAIANSSVVFDESDSDGAAAKSVGVAVTPIAADEYIDLVVAVDAGTGALGEGLFVILEIDEQAQ